MKRSPFLLLVMVGIAARTFLLLVPEIVNGGDVDVYLSDEGVVGIMAIHILEGRELPLFFFGQDYLGSLEAYLAAASFALFGSSLLTLRLVTFLVSLGLLVVLYAFVRREHGIAAARWATVLVACAPLYFLQWNLKARGGFVEHLVLVVVIMMLFWSFFLHERRDVRTTMLLGLVAGIAFWVNQLVLAYLLVMGLLLLTSFHDRRGWALFIACFALGASLLIVHNVRHPLATFRTLARKAVVLNRVPVEKRDERWLERGIGKRVEAVADGADKLGIVFGVPPRAGVERLGLTEDVRSAGTLTSLRRLLAWIPVLVFGTCLVSCWPRREPTTGRRPWSTSEPLLLVFFLVTVVVGYVSPRYMLPAYPLAAMMAAALVVRLDEGRRRLLVGGLVAVLAFNVLSWLDVEGGVGSGDEDRIASLIAVLEAHELSHCYAAGPMYHAVFAARERVIIAPLQKDRYPPYADAVGRAERICYLFRDDQADKRQHRAFRRFLEDRGIRYLQTESGPYTVLYAFEPRAAITGEVIREIRRGQKTGVSVDVLEAF